VPTRHHHGGRAGATVEQTLIEGRDAVRARQFWAAAERAQAKRRSMSAEQLAALNAAESDGQGWLDAL